MTPQRERQELLNFMRAALDYFDAAAEGQAQGDPAALFSEGKVCLNRLEHEETK